MVSNAKEDLPDPDRPVITVRLSRGISRSIFFRLCSRAPRTWIEPAMRDPQRIDWLTWIAFYRCSPYMAVSEHRATGERAMAGSVNKVVLVGNLGRDPEVRNTQDGAKIVQLSIATSETWNDKASGERKERTEWHRVVIFNDRVADVAERYLKKGAKIYVEGSLQTRKWTDQSGQERYTTEVVIGRFNGQLTMLDTRASAAGGEAGFGGAPDSGGGGFGGGGGYNRSERPASAPRGVSGGAARTGSG